MKRTALAFICLMSAFIACTITTQAVELFRTGLRVGVSSAIRAPLWSAIDEDVFRSTSWTSPLAFSTGLVGDLNVGDPSVLLRLEPLFRQFESTSLFEGQGSFSSQSLELTSRQAIIELPASVVYRLGDSTSPFRPYGFGGFILGIIASQTIKSVERDAFNAQQPSVTKQKDLGFSMLPFTVQAGCGAEVNFSSGISLVLDGRIMWAMHGTLFGPPVVLLSSGGLDFDQMFPPVPSLSVAGGISLLVRM